MSLTEQAVLEALSRVRYPPYTRDIVSFGMVRDVSVAEGRVRFRLEARGASAETAARLLKEARDAVRKLPGCTDVEALPSPAPAREAAPLLPDVASVIAVASGKGGVGKSTVAVNLAVALARSGSAVGLMDADVYGPSIPMMMGIKEVPAFDETRTRIIPFERHGVRIMSLGFFLGADEAVIWRGPMVMKAVEQLLRDVAWGKLDVLVVDMPPGTGDAQLTLSQKANLTGAVIVTTPQDVALADAIKGVAMFRKVGVPILGIVENMSYFACPHCGTRTDIFGHGGGRAEAERLGVPFLGEIPLDAAVRDAGDRGTPIVAASPESPQAETFVRLASQLLPPKTPPPPERPGGLRGVLSRLRSE